MDVEEVDPVSGRKTTGHEWNGIKELDTPVPRGVLMFLVATHLFALLWWVLMPTWPLGTTYTKGVLGTDQWQRVEKDLVESQAARLQWTSAIEAKSYDEIIADENLMQFGRASGRQLFGDNCAACHGTDGKGRFNYPNLTDEDWLWGGGPDNIAETLRVGINSPHDETRTAEMPAFGRDQMLERTEIRQVALYVHSLTNPATSTPENVAEIQAGREVFLSTCAACHGEDAKWSQEVGAPNLTDTYWGYGGDMQTLLTTIHGGRRGHMPTWDERLTEVEIKTLALYVNDLALEAR